MSSSAADPSPASPLGRQLLMALEEEEQQVSQQSQSKIVVKRRRVPSLFEDVVGSLVCCHRTTHYAIDDDKCTFSSFGVQTRVPRITTQAIVEVLLLLPQQPQEKKIRSKEWSSVKLARTMSTSKRNGRLVRTPQTPSKGSILNAFKRIVLVGGASRCLVG
jgi:hypothetical protein